MDDESTSTARPATSDADPRRTPVVADLTSVANPRRVTL